MRELRFAGPDYAELLGLYLGDGSIAEGERTWRLRIALDSKYVKVVDETEALLIRSFPDNRVGRVLAHEGRMTSLSVYCSHLPCLFPQHGEGLKHRREIALERWQEEVVGAEPWSLLRGLIRSDGCSFMNRTGGYEYLSFNFANCSSGVMSIFEAACAQVGVACRTTYTASRAIWQSRVNRREDVERMVAHVGVKE